MNDRFKLFIGSVFTFFLLISLLLTVAGGAYYIFKEGQSIKYYHVFQNSSQIGLQKIWQEALTLSPVGIIQMGILILIFSQLLRVVLIAFYYVKSHDFKFMFFSFFIIGFIIFSFFLNF